MSILRPSDVREGDAIGSFCDHMVILYRKNKAVEIRPYRPLYQCDVCGIIHSRRYVRQASFASVTGDIRDSEGGWYCMSCYNKRLSLQRARETYREIVVVTRKLKRILKEKRNEHKQNHNLRTSESFSCRAT